MATSSKRDVQLAVQIKTAGEAELARLAAQVRNLSQEGGDAAAEYRRVADALDDLSARAGELDEIKSLAGDFERLTAAQRQANEAAQASETAYREQAAVVAALRSAEQSAREEVRQAKQARDELTNALSKARAEGQKAGESEAAYADRIRETRLQLADQRLAVQNRARAVQEAADAVRQALPLERELATAYARSAAEATKIEAALGRQEAALVRAKTSAEAAGRSVDDLAAAERSLVSEAQRLAAAADGLVQDQQSLAAAAEEGAAAMRKLEAASKAADQAMVDATRAILAEEQAAREAAAAAERQAQATFDAAEAQDDWAEASKRAKAAIDSELAALRESEQFVKRYEQALQEAAAAARKLADAEDAESMRKLERAAQEADAEIRQLAQSLRATEAAAQAYAAATAQAAGASGRDAAASRDRVQAAEALISTERELTAAQRDLANERDRTRAGLLAEAQAYLASARAAEQSREATARLVTQARAAGDTLERAFGQTGVRSLQAIEAEIRDVDVAVSLLERRMRSGAISQDEFARASSSAQVRLQTLKREMETIPRVDNVFERANASLTGLLTRFGALTAAVGTLGLAARPIIDATVALDQMRRVLTTVSGGAEQAEAQIEFLRQTSQRAGQQFTEVGASYSKFAASALQSGLSLKTVQDVFQSVALAAGNLGLSSDQTKRALEALSQIASKGVVSMEELRQQLGDALPGVLPLLARELGLTQAELNKVVESGQLLASEAIPAIGRSLRALEPQGGVVNGLVAEWNRFINVVKQAGTALTEGPLGQAVGYGLLGLSKAVSGLSVIVVSASEGLRMFGVTAVATADLLAGDTSWEQYKKTISDFALESASNIRSFTQTVRGANEQSQALGGGLQALGTSFARLALDQQKAIDAAALLAQSAEKNVQAKAKEAEAVLLAADALGDEAAAQKAAIEAARLKLAAVEQQLAADERLVEVTRAAKVAVEEKAQAEGKSRDEIRAAVEALDEKIAKTDADAAKTRAAAEAARAFAESVELAAEKARDNSGRIDELRAAVEAAEVAYRSSQRALRLDATTSDDARKAADALAKAKGLLRDAVDDLTEALEEQLGAMRAEAAFAKAALELDLARAKNSQRQAEIDGNATKARLEAIRIKELELQIDRVGNNLKVDEAEATLRALDQQERELGLLGQLTPEKQRQIEIKRKNTLATILEAEADREGNKEKVEEIKNLRLGGESRTSYSQATRDSTSATDGNTASTRSNTDAMSANRRATDEATSARKRYNDLLQADPSRLVGGAGLGGISQSPTGLTAGDAVGGADGFSDFDSEDYRNNVVREAGGIQVDVPEGYYYTLDPNAPGVERRAGYTKSGQPIPGYFARKTPTGGAGAGQGGPFGGSAGAPSSGGPRPGVSPAQPVSAASTGLPATTQLVTVVHEVSGRGFSSVMTADEAERFLATLEQAKANGG